MKRRLSAKRVLAGFAAGLLAGAILLGTSGCFRRGWYGPAVKARMLQYMEDRYGETFAVLNTDTQGERDKGRQMTVESAAFPGIPILVRYDPDTDQMSDSYQVLLFSDAAIEELRKLVESVYGPCKIFPSFTNGVTIPETAKFTSVQEYLSHRRNGFMVSIFVEKPYVVEEREGDLAALEQALKENKIYVQLNLSYLTAENFEKVSQENYNDYFTAFNEKYVARVICFQNVEFRFSSLEWKEGEL